MRRPPLVLLGASLTVTSANGLVLALMADLQEHLDLTTSSLGLVTASYFVAYVATQLVLPRVADRGHSRSLMLAGLAATVCSLIGVAYAHSLAQLIGARVLSGVAVGAFLPATRRIVSLRFPDRVGEYLGLLTAVELIGWTVSPVGAGVMRDSIGLRSPFLTLAVVCAVAFVGLLPWDPVVDVPSSAGETPLLPLDLLRIRSVAAALVLGTAAFLPVGFYDALWSRYLHDRGASTTFVGVSLAVFGLPYAAFATTGGRLADRYGGSRIAYLGLCFVVPATIAYGLAQRPGVVLAIAVVEATGGSLVNPAVSAKIARAVPSDRLAQAMGLLGALPSVVAVFTGLAAAPMYSAWGAGPTLGGAAALMVVLALAAWRHEHQTGQSCTLGVDVLASRP